MKNKDAIFLSIKYVEDNIKEKLTAKDVARKIEYSLYHFSSSKLKAELDNLALKYFE